MKKLALVAIAAIVQTSCGPESSSTSAEPSPIQKPTPAQAVIACPKGAPADQCQSFLLTLQGKNGQPPNTNDMNAVAGAIGSLVTQMKVQNYIVIQTYTTGGFQSCLDPIANGGYNAAVYVFNTFAVGNQTSWDIQPVKACTGGH